MVISEARLSGWANAAPTTMAADTHASIRGALGTELGLDVFLQGSYKNRTNTRGSSDVDVIAAYEDVSAETDLAETWSIIRGYVEGKLGNVYASHNVSPGPKCITVLGGGSRLDADVVPALSILAATFDGRREPGILFYDKRRGVPIVNFPKQHYLNGVAKHQATQEWYKASVRMFKTARDLVAGRAANTPSYFLECFLYNAPDDLYGESHQATFVRVLKWLADTDARDFLCQNECLKLFGPAETQWDEGSARSLVRGLASLWTNGG